MNNNELKEAVAVYWEVKNELDKLQATHLKHSFKVQVITELDVAIREEYKKKAVIELRVVQEKIYYPDQEKVIIDERESLRKLMSEEVQRKIKYLELKLNVVKRLLGEEVVKELEKNEKKAILKNLK